MDESEESLQEVEIMKLIDLVHYHTNESRSYIIVCCCPSDYGKKYEKYESHEMCARGTCTECWEQELED